jgi:hypothetical protein
MGDDRDWVYFPRRLPEFEAGVNEFLDASFAKSAIGGEINCPCKQCRNRFWGSRKEVKDHLVGQGFVRNYYVPDPIQDSLHYVVNKVPRDLFDFEEESSENVADSYWCEPNENRSEYVAQTNEHDGELLRNDMPPVVVYGFAACC